MNSLLVDSFYNKLSDEQLVLLFSFNPNIISILISRYERFIKKKALVFSKQNIDIDDLFQEGVIGLFEAVRSFNINRSSNFKSFAFTCILNSIKKNYASSTTNKVNFFVESLKFGENIDNLCLQYCYDPESIALSKENFVSLKCEVETILSSLEKVCLFLYLKGYSYKMISYIINSSQKSIDNALQRVRRKLKQVLY